MKKINFSFWGVMSFLGYCSLGYTFFVLLSIGLQLLSAVFNPILRRFCFGK